MKTNKKFRKAFGINEFDLINFPAKISNIKISRIQNSEKRGGCTICFPHGFETTNSTISNNQKNWKKFRKNQWK